MSLHRMRISMENYSKYLILVIAVVFAVGFIALAIPGINTPTQQTTTMSRIVAKVNGQKLDRKVYEERVGAQLDQMSQAGPVSAIEEADLRAQIFDMMIDEMLKLQAAKKERIRVSRSEVNKRIDEYVEQEMQQIKMSVLQGRREKMTDEAFAQELARRRPGMTIPKLRDEIRKNIKPDMVRTSLILEKLSKKIRDRVDTSDRALRASFEELHLRQITIGMHKRSPAQAEKQAKELVAKLRAGADFATMAKANSDDILKDKGGDYGYVRPEVLDPDLARVAVKMKPGEISDPVKITEGYVILNLVDKRENLPKDFDNPAKQREYRENFIRQAQARAESLYYYDLRKNAKIEIFDPELKAHQLVQDTFTMFGPTTAPQRKAKLEEAIRLLRTAIDSAGDFPNVKARSYAKMAEIYLMLKSGDFSLSPQEMDTLTQNAIEAYEDALVYTESNDIRMRLAEMYVEKGEYKKAIQHLEIASENAYDDYQTHVRIQALYKRMNRPDLVAKEQKWMDENKQLLEQQRGQVMPQGAAAPPGQ